MVLAALVIAALLVYVFFFRKSSASINDACFDWKLPAGITIERYDPCSSLTLLKTTDGREIKANFVLTKPIVGGGKDSFLGNPEEATVDGNKLTRYVADTRDSDAGLGTYHIDYSINYDRIPLKTEKSGGRTFLTAEFVLATKHTSHVSDEEVEDFVKLTDSVMAALHTK
jgi:hypothetical protein